MNQYWATWNIRTTHFRTLQSAVILVCLSSHGCISIPLQWEFRVTTVLPLCKFQTFVYSLPMASHGHRYFPGSLSFPSVFWVILGTPGAARSIWRTSAALPAVLAASAISSLCSRSRSDVSALDLSAAWRQEWAQHGESLQINLAQTEDSLVARCFHYSFFYLRRGTAGGAAFSSSDSIILAYQ